MPLTEWQQQSFSIVLHTWKKDKFVIEHTKPEKVRIGRYGICCDGIYIYFGVYDCWYEVEHSCNKCPIKEFTDKTKCENTPYGKWLYWLVGKPIPYGSTMPKNALVSLYQEQIELTQGIYKYITETACVNLPVNRGAKSLKILTSVSNYGKDNLQ